MEQIQHLPKPSYMEKTEFNTRLKRLQHKTDWCSHTPAYSYPRGCGYQVKFRNLQISSQPHYTTPILTTTLHHTHPHNHTTPHTSSQPHYMYHTHPHQLYVGFYGYHGNPLFIGTCSFLRAMFFYALSIVPTKRVRPLRCYSLPPHLSHVFGSLYKVEPLFLKSWICHCSTPHPSSQPHYTTPILTTTLHHTHPHNHTTPMAHDFKRVCVHLVFLLQVMPHIHVQYTLQLT